MSKTERAAPISFRPTNETQASLNRLTANHGNAITTTEAIRRAIAIGDFFEQHRGDGRELHLVDTDGNRVAIRLIY